MPNHVSFLYSSQFCVLNIKALRISGQHAQTALLQGIQMYFRSAKMHTKVLHNQDKFVVYDNTDTYDTKMHCAVNAGSVVGNYGKSSSARPEWFVSSEEVDFHQTSP